MQVWHAYKRATHLQLELLLLAALAQVRHMEAQALVHATLACKDAR